MSFRSHHERKTRTPYPIPEAGRADYIAFIRSFLGFDEEEVKFHQDSNYQFQVYDDPNQLFDAIQSLDTKERKRQALQEGKSESEYDYYNGHSRVVSGYTYEWKSSQASEMALRMWSSQKRTLPRSGTSVTGAD